MRILCLVFIAISVVLAILNDVYKITAIAYLMGLSWGTLAGCFIGPYVLGLLWKKVTKPAVWTSIIGSLVITAVLIVVLGYDKAGWACSFGIAIKNGISVSPLIGDICMIFSLISTFVVSLFTKRPSDTVLENAFNKPIENAI
jgi:Na+(H+)/acetate symporter ActP